MTARIDLTGKKFGRWSVISYAGRLRWSCRCDCGTAREVAGTSLRRGISMSCLRCSTAAGNRRTHGESKTRLYRCWDAMKQRCTNPNATAYVRYGGRGIKVCEEWMANFEAFRDWALENGYADELTIERRHNDRDYEPSNCCWATYAEQNRNNSRNRHLIIDGRKVVAADLAIEAGLPPDVVRQRIHRYGWTIEKALSTPVKHGRHEPWAALGMSRTTYYRRPKHDVSPAEKRNVDDVMREAEAA